MILVTASAAISDPQLSGSAFVGERWRRGGWAARRGSRWSPKKTAFRRECDPAGKASARTSYGRFVGRCGDKDSVASEIGSAAAISDYRPMLRTGERRLCLACGCARARIVHRYIAGYFVGIRLVPLVERERLATGSISAIALI
jgi:hypothetical protein